MRFAISALSPAMMRAADSVYAVGPDESFKLLWACRRAPSAGYASAKEITVLDIEADLNDKSALEQLRHEVEAAMADASVAFTEAPPGMRLQQEDYEHAAAHN